MSTPETTTQQTRGKNWGFKARTVLSQRDVIDSDYFRLRGTSKPEWKVSYFAATTLAIFVPYGLFFGPGVTVAFGTLFGHDRHVSSATDASHLVNAGGNLLAALLIVVGLIAIFYWIRPRFGLTSMPVRVHRVGWVAFLYTLALLLFSWSVPLVNGWFGQHHAFPRGPDHSPAAAIDAIASSILAGVSEEIIITVVPVLLLRAVDIPWKFIVALLLFERILFHVYYGPGVVTVLIWAGLSILLYRYTQSALGLVLAHAIYDVYCDISVYLGDDPAFVVLVAALLLYALLILAGHIRAKSR